MTLHRAVAEVGVRELHDRLSEHLECVVAGQDLVVTRRGKPIARISAVDADPFADFARRGLLSPPRRARDERRAGVRAGQPVSELVAEQRR